VPLENATETQPTNMQKLLSTAIALILAANGAAAQATGGEQAGIERFNEALRQATLHMDNAATLSLWEESGVSLLPAAAPITGKRALAAFLDRATSSMSNAKMRSFTLECFDLHVSGDWASEWCTEHQIVDLAGGKQFDGRGKMLLVLHRGPAGAWRIQNEMWNEAAKAQ
jgi:ketosteroid isomerase-like protein